MNSVLFGKRLGTLAWVTAGFLVAAMLLVFFYAPEDADQGFRQKIFYVHVPMAIVALCGFVAGGIFAIILANIVAFFLMRAVGKNLDR